MFVLQRRILQLSGVPNVARRPKIPRPDTQFRQLCTVVNRVSTVSHRILLGSQINLTNSNLLGQYRLLPLISYSCLILNNRIGEGKTETERQRERELRIHARVYEARTRAVVNANFHFTDCPSSTFIDFVSARSSISIAAELARRGCRS